MADSVIGLMIDSDKIRAVEVQKWKGANPRAIRAGEIQLPPSAFVNGLIIDPEALSSALRTLWRAERFGTKRVILSVDGRQAIVRRTELPTASADGMRRAAGFDIEELLSYPLDEAIFDVSEIEDADSMTDHQAANTEEQEAAWGSAIVIAIHESTRQSLLDVVAAAGLKPAGLYLASEALARSVAATGEPAEPPGGDSPSRDGVAAAIAVVAVGENQTDVVIRDSGGILFSRTLTVGVGVTALNVADELESHLEGLSGYRSRTDGQTESERRASIAQAGLSTVVEGVRRTLSYYQSELDRRGIARIVITGPRAQVDGLVPAMSSALGATVQLGEPRVAWRQSLGSWHGYATALGAVLSNSRSARDQRTFSLEPWADQERRGDRHRMLIGTAAAVAVAGFLVSLSASRSEIVRDQEAIATGLEKNVDGLGAEIASYEGLVAQADLVQFKAGQVGTIRQQQIRFPLVLQEVAAAMPVESQLTSITMGRADASQDVLGYFGPRPVGVLALNGLAEDLSGVGDFVLDMSASELATGFWLNQSTIGPIGGSDRTGATFSMEGVITQAAQSTALGPPSSPSLASDGGGS